MKTCAVCKQNFPEGDSRIGTFGTDEESSRYPVCEGCHLSGKHEKWRYDAIIFLQSCPVKGECSGNLAADYERILAHLRQNSRIEEGICPNGCSKMFRLDSHHAKCPVCEFVYYHNMGVEKIFEIS